MALHDRPSSVLLVVHVPQHSGPQRSLMPRLEALKGTGSRVTTLVPGPGAAADVATTVGEVVTGGPEALVIPRRLDDLLALPGRLRRESKTLRNAVGESEADLVIVSSALMPSAMIGARRAGVGVLLYSGEVLGGPGLRGLVQRVAARLAGHLADAVVACSEAAAQAFRSQGADVSVVYPPIEAPAPADDLEERARELRTWYRIDPDVPIVSSLGAITEGRGQDTLIKALRLSRARGSYWHLLVAGDPYDRPNDLAFRDRLLREIDQLNLRNHVTLAGRINDTQALFHASDAFVNPVRAPESFGRASCEAILAGCPVVSTRVGGTHEALIDDRTALLIPPDSPNEMSAAIDRLLTDHELAAAFVSEGGEDIAARLSPGAGAGTFTLAVDRALATGEARSRSG